MNSAQRKMVVRSALISVTVVVVLLNQCVGSAQTLSALSGEQVLENVERTFAGIEDYTVTLDVSADLERLKVPHMQATMYFKQPDKVHFVTEGFALLPREGMAMSLGKLRSKYTVESMRDETVDGREVILLNLRPRAERLRAQGVTLYIDPIYWTVIRGTVRLPDARRMVADFEYQWIEERWLPSKFTARFSTAPVDTTDLDFFEQISPTRRPQLPRNGTVTVRYSDYKINTGLSDDIFENSPTSPRNER